MPRGRRRMRLKRKKLCFYAAAGVLAYFLYMTCLPIHLDILTLARKTGTHSTVLKTELTHNLLLVFWIRDILLRIRIPGSVPRCVVGLQAAKKTQFFLCFLCLHNFSKIKKSQNSRNQGFSYFFCLIIEGFGFVPLSIRIRIPNTAFTAIH
jgi:hypothetical protein